MPKKDFKRQSRPLKIPSSPYKREEDKDGAPVTFVHKHCPVCAKPMDIGRDFCSEECEKTVMSRKKSQRRTMWIMMGIIGLIMLVSSVLMPILLLGSKPGGP